MTTMAPSKSTPGLMGDSKLNFGRTAKTATNPGKITMQETMALFNSVYSGGFSSYLSSNTLRNSPKHWSFSKADRFMPIIPDNCAKYTSFPTELNPRYSSLGFGGRGFLRDLPAAHSPPPTQYKIRSAFDGKEKRKGKTFGISRNYYENVYIPGINIVTPAISGQVPGPGQYASAETNPIGKNARKVALKSRVPQCTSATKEFPAPNMYKPGFGLTEQNRFNGVGFGVGNRGNPTGPASLTITPGPGTYRLASPFDKFTRISLIGKIHKLKPIKLPQEIKTERKEEPTLEGKEEKSL